MKPGLTWIDNLVIATYLICIVAIGLWHGRRQKNTEEYLLAGRSMSWWPIAISLFAAFFSSISYVAIPGEAFNYGLTMYLQMFFLALPLPVALLVFLRLFYKLKLWTAYEYLERRFNVTVRMIGAVVFLLTRCVYLGVALYATALVLKPALGWSFQFSIMLIAGVGLVYASIGGLKGVIWTDVAQFIVLVGGVLVIIVYILFKLPNGISDIWEITIATKHGFNVGPGSGFWDFDFNQRITIWAWLTAAIPNCIAPVTDQVNLQLCLSCKNYASLAKSMIGSAVGGWPVVFLFYIAGLALLAYTKTVGLGTPIAEMTKGDQAYTYFVTHVLPVGCRGLIVAGLLAAIMSTVVSVLNSLATVTLKDIYQRLVVTDRDEAYYLKTSKILTVIWGALAVVLGCGIAYICAKFDVSLLEISNVCLGIFGGILLGLFTLGLLNFRADSLAAIIGVVGSAVITGYVAVFHFLLQPIGQRISFLWLGVIAPLAVLFVGSIAGIFRPGERKSELVVWGNPLLSLKEKEK